MAEQAEQVGIAGQAAPLSCVGPERVPTWDGEVAQ
jgi:hypothetical protein